MATTKIFVIEDDQFLGNLIKKTLEKIDNLEVSHFTTPEECLSNLHLNPDIISIDYLLPGMNGLELLEKIKNYNSDIQCIMVSGQEKLDVVIETYRQGASDYIIKNDNALINLENSVKNLCKSVYLRQENEALKEQIIDRNKYTSILGSSGAVLRVLKLIQKVEKSNIMVLVTGQSGTGKELVARSIHYNSPRAKKPFVTVNMAAIPEDLIESELFGHEKGAFTDARDRRIGKFEEANEGTIFLDEIGEMDLMMQTKLLRVLQEKEVTRIGSNKSIKLDVRVLAATNRNLSDEVKAGRFREDLFYRLQGFLIHLPPLYERGEDVILLSKTFLSDFCKENKMPAITLSKDAAKFLMEYKWPGNVRELKAVIERAAIMSDNQEISPEDLVFPNS
ncbi:MAG: sigma-54-dependent Fis family transcriptional regulator [Bacteroidetes bacterium]|nr:MAG: sigma-54-dependent Fis family transcriptional regulator [Bacteroidota bacterium]